MSVSSITSNHFKVSKSSHGNGTTHKIRENLNFKDDKKWKQFSSRRLELIDKFGLASKKASEQDDNIKQIATILRTEFAYPVSYASEFEKLVTAAVQSVRRNRKRSKKISNIPLSLTPSDSASPTPSDDDRQNNSSSGTIPHVGSSHGVVMAHSKSAQVISYVPSPGPGLLSSSSTPTQFQLPAIQVNDNESNNAEVANSDNTFKIYSDSNITNSYSDVIKLVISDIVNVVVSLSEQSKKDENSGFPNLKDFALSNQDHNLLALKAKNEMNAINKEMPLKERSPSPFEASHFQNADIPFFLKEKLLLHIQRSRTSSEITYSQGSVELYANLETLGKMAVNSSVAFVVERFFSSLLPSCMEYITSKTMSEETLNLLSTKLFNNATNQDLTKLPARQVNLKILFLLVGAVVKDFGFDPVLYPLNEIIHHIIMKQYPLIQKENGNSLPKNSSMMTSPADGSSFHRNVLFSTTSMKPQVANQEINKKIIIKFKDHQQTFTFPLLSNGAPTISEILENSKSLFNIVQPISLFGLYHKNELLTNDNEVVTLFNNFPLTNEVVLEIKEKEDKSVQVVKPTIIRPSTSPPVASGTAKLDGLNMLSAVSSQIKEEPMSSQAKQSTLPLSRTPVMQISSSVSKLDNIISRIGSSPKIGSLAKSNSMPKSSFHNNNLPQPSFQPLL